MGDNHSSLKNFLTSGYWGRLHLVWVIFSMEGMLSWRAIHPILNIDSLVISVFLPCGLYCIPGALLGRTNKNEIGHIPNGPPSDISSVSTVTS